MEPLSQSFQVTSSSPELKSIEPIAKINSCYTSKFATPRQPGLSATSYGEIVFEKAFRGEHFLRGIESFSHIWVIFGFHETEGKGWSPTVRPPRLGGNTRIGVFASRATHRPNGLGLSVLRVEKINWSHPNGPILEVSGLDLINGTPVYDIKPYLVYAESIPDAISGYAMDAPERLGIEITPTAKAKWDQLSEKVRAVISESLSLDPRPAVQKSQQDRSFGASLCGMEVRFFVKNGVCFIAEVNNIDD